jgi:hypothetical protein
MMEIFALVMCFYYSDPTGQLGGDASAARANSCKLVDPDRYVFRSAEGCESTRRLSFPDKRDSDHLEIKYSCMHKTISTWQR